ncbi:MAG: DUF2163 domain-containing protein [Paracoccaceae bacterium]
MAIDPQLLAHLKSGATTVCRAWALRRRDGQEMGFTDHDLDLHFGGLVFHAATGMSARALQSGSGLSVDNTEAVGALSADAITEADILAGRYDGAEVRAWLVNWAEPAQRVLQFRGSIGEIRRAGGAFTAELRGLTEVLNRPQGRIYQPQCAALLGDAACGVDLEAESFSVNRAAEIVTDRRAFRFVDFVSHADRWFERGRLRVLTGHAAGLIGMIKNDRLSDAGREVELWQELGAEIAPGDMLRIEAGCDKRLGTCRLKFGNIRNFRGFPHIPGDDWLMSYPRRNDNNNGGSLRG